MHCKCKKAKKYKAHGSSTWNFRWKRRHSTFHIRFWEVGQPSGVLDMLRERPIFIQVSIRVSFYICVVLWLPILEEYCWWFRNLKQPPFGCIKSKMWFQLPTCQLVFSPDFWLPSTASREKKHDRALPNSPKHSRNFEESRCSSMRKRRHFLLEKLWGTCCCNLQEKHILTIDEIYMYINIYIYIYVRIYYLHIITFTWISL